MAMLHCADLYREENEPAKFSLWLWYVLYEDATDRLSSLVSDDVFDLHTPPMERSQTSDHTREKRLLRKEKVS